MTFISSKMCLHIYNVSFIKTRAKTSIRYAKENDREKREDRKKGRRRDIERDGEIRER